MSTFPIFWLVVIVAIVAIAIFARIVNDRAVEAARRRREEAIRQIEEHWLASARTHPTTNRKKGKPTT